MATLLEPALMTAEEFHDWANQPERGNTLYELDNGKVVEMPSPGERHGYLCGWIGHLLWNYCMMRGQGRVLSNDTGVLVRRSPDSVRGPDLMLFLDNKPIDQMSVKHVTDIPTLVVEVRSPTDRDAKILKRVKQYLQRGIPMVWVVDPEDRVVMSYRDHEFPKLHDEDDTLTGNGVLPDFSCVVREFFQLPGTHHTPTASA